MLLLDDDSSNELRQFPIQKIEIKKAGVAPVVKVKVHGILSEIAEEDDISQGSGVEDSEFIKQRKILQLATVSKSGSFKHLE